MFTLVKIRAKYLQRHSGAVFCTYYFIPSMLIFSILTTLMFNGGRIDTSEHYILKKK